MSATAWLLEPDGTVAVVTRVRKLVWPSTAEVTFEDGSTELTHVNNVLSGDNLELRYFSHEATRARERAALARLMELEGDDE